MPVEDRRYMSVEDRYHNKPVKDRHYSVPRGPGPSDGAEEKIRDTEVRFASRRGAAFARVSAAASPADAGRPGAILRTARMWSGMIEKW
jgi:hypothetical protein